MAWGGKTQTRMNDKQRKHFFRTANRRLPDPPNPEKEVLNYNELMQAALKKE